MPPRFKPFTSFLTQGMNNTNQNINNMNQPSNPGVHNPLSQSFTGGGGGNVMGGQQGGAQCEGMTNIVDTETGGSLPSNIDPWQPVHATKPVEEEELSYIDPRWQSGAIQAPNIVDIPDYFEEQPTGHDVDKPWTETLPDGYEWQLVDGNWEPVFVGPNYLQEDPLADYTYIPGQGPLQSYALGDYTGGGGTAGQAAKKLYYPGTQGGFASVGSGIGGQQNMLDNLLMNLKG